MKRNSLLYFLFIFFGSYFVLVAQDRQKIKFQKEQSYIYFFQKGPKRDTIAKGHGDCFYLLVPDSLKPFLSIQTENAQFLKGDNDSLVKLNFVKGYKYESLYLAVDPDPKKKQKVFEFKTLVNGVSTSGSEIIEIEMIDLREKNVLLKNTFYYKIKN